MKRTEKKNNKKKEKKTSVWKGENETIKIERKQITREKEIKKKRKRMRKREKEEKGKRISMKILMEIKKT